MEPSVSLPHPSVPIPLSFSIQPSVTFISDCSGLSPTIDLNTPSNFDSIPSSNGTYSINPTTGLDEAFSLSSTFFGFNSTTSFKPTVSNIHSQPSIALDPIIGINTTLLSLDSSIRSIGPNPITVKLSPNPTIEFNRAFSLAKPTVSIRLSVSIQPSSVLLPRF
jgi:hypothetical protein